MTSAQESAPGRWILRSGHIVPDAASDVIHDGGVLVEDARVQAVGRFSVLSTTYPLARVIDRRGEVVLPGFVDAHSHGRAMPLEAQGIADVSLEQFFLRIPAMTMLDPCDDSFVAGADLLTTGVTSAQVNFHTFAPPARYLQQACDTVDGLCRSLIRPTLIPCLTEQHEFVPESLLGSAPSSVRDIARVARGGIGHRDYFEIVRALRARAGRGVAIGLGPCAPQWCSEATWSRVGEMLGSGARAQTHLLETRVQRSPAYGPPAVDKLMSAGAMSERLSAAHGVWLTDDELTTVARSGVTLVHCPGSNTRLRSGTARVRRWLDAGIRVGLGLDSNTMSYPPDAFVELRHAAAMASEVGALTRRELFELATSGGAAAVGMQDELGALRPGYRADLISLSLPAPPGKSSDLLEHALSVATRGSVRAVWVDGSPAVRQGRHVDAAEVAHARRRLRGSLDADAPARTARIRNLAEPEEWAQAQFAVLEGSREAGTPLQPSMSPRVSREPVLHRKGGSD